MVKTVIFLGAGASSADGAPLQGELFKKYFLLTPNQQLKPEVHDSIKNFLAKVFKIDFTRPISEITFPTFEEVLGIVDLGLIRNETFMQFGNLHNFNNLNHISKYLTFLVAKILDIKLKNFGRHHKILIQKLNAMESLTSTAFISTNYDILIDNAITEIDSVDLDYGVDFSNYDVHGDWKRPVQGREIYLLKPHGSLNWLLCQTCNELTLTPNEKGVVERVISETQSSMCRKCSCRYSPLIVPPTYYKNLSNVFLGEIWNKTERVLQTAQHLIFCGYSLPDADMHIKYLIKRGQFNRNDLLKITVINNYSTKSQQIFDEEKARFVRYLGSDINYTDISFENFSNDPSSVVD